MKSIQIIALIIVLIFSHTVLSQTEVIVRDLETWSSVSASKKFESNAKLELEQSLRLYDNTSKVDQYFTNLSLELPVFKFASITGGLRYIRDRDKDDGEYENHLRFNADLNFKHEYERFTFKYRLRLQTKNELGYSRDEGDYLRNATRVKVGINYNIRNWKFDPEIAGEIFRESGKYMISSFNKYRLTLSTKYKINKLMDLKAFYRFERELGVSYPLSTNIVGFNLTFNL